MVLNSLQKLGPLNFGLGPNHFALGAQPAPGEKKLVCIPADDVKHTLADLKLILKQSYHMTLHLRVT